MTVKQPPIEIQRRQCVIEVKPDGARLVHVRWDEHQLTLGVHDPFPPDMTLEQIQRYCCDVQLGRAVQDVGWTMQSTNDNVTPPMLSTCHYSDTFLTLSGGGKPTRAQIEAYRAQAPRATVKTGVCDR